MVGSICGSARKLGDILYQRCWLRWWIRLRLIVENLVKGADPCLRYLHFSDQPQVSCFESCSRRTSLIETINWWNESHPRSSMYTASLLGVGFNTSGKEHIQEFDAIKFKTCCACFIHFIINSVHLNRPLSLLKSSCGILITPSFKMR